MSKIKDAHEMTESQGLRHHCRNPRCRMKLKEPVENPYKAFCTSGCHSSFYRSRCIVCEQPIMKWSSRRELCDKPKCQGAFRGNQQRFRYPTPANAANGSRNPHGMGIKTSPQWRPTSPFADAPLNILGGGSFRWPDTPRLDAETLEKIRIREVGLSK